VFTSILFPAVVPYMLTGIRLAIGVAWLVIVAAEMLTGGVGIGFWCGTSEQPQRGAHHHRDIHRRRRRAAARTALMLIARRFEYR